MYYPIQHVSAKPGLLSDMSDSCYDVGHVTLKYLNTPHEAHMS